MTLGPCVIDYPDQLGWSEDGNYWYYRAHYRVNEKNKPIYWQHADSWTDKSIWANFLPHQQEVLALIKRDRAILVKAALQGHQVAQFCLKLINKGGAYVKT